MSEMGRWMSSRDAKERTPLNFAFYCYLFGIIRGNSCRPFAEKLVRLTQIHVLSVNDSAWNQIRIPINTKWHEFAKMTQTSGL
ncbi:hypothetical protein Heshes_07880 [Alicyclobacillus hesperidum]|uniref:Uncharacterized protein n=1 Tax=Alicyclobacillus hesperidum TaxID=89784 RepID=A0AA37X6H8_9BACL|nr:hypothetical protein Heshes_07880 [Alicyclobacillus hesperidum]